MLKHPLNIDITQLMPNAFERFLPSLNDYFHDNHGNAPQLKQCVKLRYPRHKTSDLPIHYSLDGYINDGYNSGISIIDIGGGTVARTSPYESGELTDSIFLILLATLEPIHGYRIMQVIQDMTEGDVEIGPATMYTTLRKLKNAGWIAEANEEDLKISYQITDEGKIILLENFNKRIRMVEIAKKHLAKEGK
ncbi:PadR family transcriptional regulator [Paenibacillus sp. NPDC056722]|uniref:PadR family transcriptional regulator n=1 Tax=Paenibacillus sp. NPDC056722 TaxID=3345924 RepID=UPI0036A0859A